MFTPAWSGWSEKLRYECIFGDSVGETPAIPSIGIRIPRLGKPSELPQFGKLFMAGSLSAILLAGGDSRRMGVDKATVVIGGEPLWQRQFRILRELKLGALWLSAKSVPSWCPQELQIIADEPPSRGPLSGVAAGLSRLETSHLLVLAIDLPRMTAEHLQKLWSMARPGIGVIPQNGNYFEPLCAIYPVETFGLAEQSLINGDASLQTFAKKLVDGSQARIHRLAEDEAALYLNMNRPADVPG